MTKNKKKNKLQFDERIFRTAPAVFHGKSEAVRGDTVGKKGLVGETWGYRNTVDVLTIFFKILCVKKNKRMEFHREVSTSTEISEQQEYEESEKDTPRINQPADQSQCV